MSLPLKTLLLLLPALANAESFFFPPESGVVDVVATYGATGDGVTDDTAAIQAAIDAEKGRNRILFFRNGTYLISAPVGIFGGKAHSKDRFLTFQGQSEAGTVIRVKDGSPAFADPAKPGIALCVYEGQSTGDVMHSYVRNLTVDTGSGNPGAIGLRFLSNNTGAMERVTIRSGDGAGVIGLDLRQSQNGPCLIRRITVQGFARGIATANSFSLVFEHIALQKQQEVGFDIVDSRITIRGLRSDNAVPAVRVTQHGQLTLLEADLIGGTADQAAIVLANRADRTWLRDIRTAGYGHAIKPRSGDSVPGPVTEWADGQRYRLHGDGEALSLRLPIVEPPEVPWESDPARWIVFKAAEGSDITADLQMAIDAGVAAGATTLCFASHKMKITGPIRIHGSINRIIGMSRIIDVADPHGHFQDGQTAVFTFDDLRSEAIVVERFFLLGGWDIPSHIVMFANRSGKTVVVQHVNQRGQTKLPEPGGRWFFDDYSPGRQATLRVGKDEQVWLRQFNPESPAADMMDVDGGTVWMLGLKTEGRATHAIARNGAQVEILGGASYQSWKNQKLDPPIFRVIDAELFAALGLYHSAGHGLPFTTIIEETVGTETRTLLRKDLATYHLHGYRSSTPSR